MASKRLHLLALLTLNFAVAPAFAMPTALAPSEQRIFEEAITGKCVPPAAKDVMRSYGAQIANAPTLDAARELILGQTRLAQKALAAASWALPFSDSVREAREKITALEHRVYAANTQSEVASDFLDFLQVPEDSESYQPLGHPEGDGSPMLVAQTNLDQPVVHVGPSGAGCNYSTAEIIIIILGFIFFIIPGIIFLIIFC